MEGVVFGRCLGFFRFIGGYVRGSLGLVYDSFFGFGRERKIIVGKIGVYILLEKVILFKVR